jgi:chemotaxis protein MotB
MAGHSRRRSRRHGGGEHANEERWLLTYADMITLLMALFMVLFSISSVNISKYQTLQESLKAAFSGSILPGGKAILQSSSEATKAHSPATSEVPAIVPLTPNIPKPIDLGSGQLTNSIADAIGAVAAKVPTSAQLAAALKAARAATAEQEDFVKLKRRLDTYARLHGFSTQVQTVIERRGLVVRVLTDKVLFDSGQATLKQQGLSLLDEVAALLNVDQTHPIMVEGHTDNVPISTPEFPNNWWLSTARANTVVQYLISRGVSPARLGAAGYAYLHPVASNATATGRALNRRVEIVLERMNAAPTH